MPLADAGVTLTRCAIAGLLAGLLLMFATSLLVAV